MRKRPRRTVAVLLVASLVGAFAATGFIHAGDPARPKSEKSAAISATFLSGEAAAMRNHAGGTAERWLEQSTSSKGRSLSLAAALAVTLGVLSLVPRLHGRRLLLNSLPLTLRRHSLALRGPPSLQLV